MKRNERRDMKLDFELSICRSVFVAFCLLEKPRNEKHSTFHY